MRLSLSVNSYTWFFEFFCSSEKVGISILFKMDPKGRIGFIEKKMGFMVLANRICIRRGIEWLEELGLERNL
ncbi:hypothetical protein A0128_00395 [Leptospira tipperaryensis]|uniref:Uncharacterized protein n=1 Tax=Leptospira tipperaryensis TaxID=2564040 RepID=A0A1D7USE4_9LEPT|nr:hypothetical protein A0128_00395 [Leptospira tipperaryensis]